MLEEWPASVTARAVEAGPTLQRAAVRNEVPTGQGLGFGSEPIEGDTSLELGGEETIVVAREDLRRHVGPGAERPLVLERPVALVLAARGSHGTDIRRGVMEDAGRRIEVGGQLVVGVGDE